MMNSNGLYPAQSYSAPRPVACRAHRPKGRGNLLGVTQPPANVARPAQANAARLAHALGSHRSQSRRGGMTLVGEPVVEAWLGLCPKHQWGGRDPPGMDRGVKAHRGGAAPVGRWVRVVMAALEAQRRRLWSTPRRLVHADDIGRTIGEHGWWRMGWRSRE
jgi:hypothetical protein